jgi:hypothetical protein
VDTGQIRLNRMKLAMAVGDNRPCVIDTILARPFLPAAASCGLPAVLVQGMFDQGDATAP